MKKRFLKEDQQMMNVNRMVSGVGPGSTDNPFQQGEIPKSPSDLKTVNTTLMPHELNFVVKDVGDIYAAVLQVRKKYQDSYENPSMNDTKKAIVEKSCEKIDDIMDDLVELISLLDNFEEQL
jgi:hypothetical protein